MKDTTGVDQFKTLESRKIHDVDEKNLVVTVSSYIDINFLCPTCCNFTLEVAEQLEQVLDRKNYD